MTLIEYLNSTEITNETRQFNKELLKKYPWLNVKRFNTNITEEEENDFTWLDDMPRGWRIAFGDQICEDIDKALKKHNFENNYYIMQIKEKFGTLRWYDCSKPKELYEEMNNIIFKYEDLSEHTCIECGKPATKMSIGWISPYCDNCIGTMKYTEIERDTE